MTFKQGEVLIFCVAQVTPGLGFYGLSRRAAPHSDTLNDKHGVLMIFFPTKIPTGLKYYTRNYMKNLKAPVKKKRSETEIKEGMKDLMVNHYISPSYFIAGV